MQKILHMVTEVWIGELGKEEGRVKLHDNFTTTLVDAGFSKRKLESMAFAMSEMLSEGIDDIYKKVEDYKAS